MRFLFQEPKVQDRLSQALQESSKGNHFTFLRLLVDAMGAKWRVLIGMPHGTKHHSSEVNSATIREVARSLTAASEFHKREVQEITWEFLNKVAFSDTENEFILHSVLYAVWDRIQNSLEEDKERARLYSELDKHFRQYLVESKRLKDHYSDRVPNRELVRIGRRQLKALRTILSKNGRTN